MRILSFLAFQAFQDFINFFSVHTSSQFPLHIFTLHFSNLKTHTLSLHSSFQPLSACVQGFNPVCKCLWINGATTDQNFCPTKQKGAFQAFKIKNKKFVWDVRAAISRPQDASNMNTATI